MGDDPRTLADALDQWSPKLLDLIPWLDIIDKVALNAGRPDLAATEMQDDLRQMSADAATAARLLREQADTADRLAALTDAIDTAEQNPPDFDGYLPREAWEAAFTRITDAAAVQPPDPKEDTDG
jgi:hypothetical protein